jgi:hypothetical protein
VRPAASSAPSAAGAAPGAPTARLDRRRVLLLLAWGLLPPAALSLAGCEKPTFDRDRGVFVFRRRPDK